MPGREHHEVTRVESLNAALYRHGARPEEQMREIAAEHPPLHVLSSERLADFWGRLAINDVFRIQWSFTDRDQSKLFSWTGRKTSHTHVEYFTDDCAKNGVYDWPPPSNTIVHSLTRLSAFSARVHAGRRHNLAAPVLTTALVDMSQFDVFLSTCTPLTFVKFCASAPLRRTLPVECAPLWAATFKRCLVLCCSPDCDDATFTDSFLRVLALPRLYLDRRIKNGQLMTNLASVTAHEVSSPSAQLLLDEDPELKAIYRAERLAKDGFLHRAIVALTDVHLLDPSNPTVDAQLRERHPSHPSPPFETAPQQVMPFEAHLVEVAIDRLSNGAAPCWSGWSKELLRIATSSDKSMLTDLGIVFARLLRLNSSDSRLSQILRAGKLIAPGPGPA